MLQVICWMLGMKKLFFFKNIFLSLRIYRLDVVDIYAIKNTDAVIDICVARTLAITEKIDKNKN